MVLYGNSWNFLNSLPLHAYTPTNLCASVHVPYFGMIILENFSPAILLTAYKPSTNLHTDMKHDWNMQTKHADQCTYLPDHKDSTVAFQIVGDSGFKLLAQQPNLHTALVPYS
jgi:hypothetical protein